MGSFKLLLPWDGSTVVGRVVATLAEAGITDIVVVTGYRSEEVAGALARPPARTVFNPAYAEGEMLSSIQAGLAALGARVGTGAPAGLAPARATTRAGDAAVAAALLCLGDQPQMEAETIRALLDVGEIGGWEGVIIPSYQRRAGHPILLPRALWPEIMAGRAPLNAVLHGHRDRTIYVDVDTPSILADLDTPEDYRQAQP
jgi:molybdenum cofactor cytidylyltransferase